MIGSHDTLYTPNPGQGFNADDLQRAQLKQIEQIFVEQLPAIVELGTSVYVEHLRQLERMEALDVKLRETLAPEHGKRAREIFMERAKEILKAEAAARVVETQTAAINAAAARVEAEKFQDPSFEKRQQGKDARRR